jgi:hypothetical protein
MNTIATAVERLDWPLIAAQLNEEGYAVLSGFKPGATARMPSVA